MKNKSKTESHTTVSIIDHTAFLPAAVDNAADLNQVREEAIDKEVKAVGVLDIEEAVCTFVNPICLVEIINGRNMCIQYSKLNQTSDV